MDELDRLLAPPGDELDSLLAPNSASAQPPVTGGFRAAAKQAVGATIKGAGQLAADVAPSLVSQDNALKQYGQEVTEANPTKVQGFRDIVENPGTTVAEATGNAAGSIGAMLGMRALGTGITAAAPLAGLAAPIVAGAGQLVSWGGPALVAALPSFGGIRGKQIEKDPTAAGDFKDKAIAALGAATVGIIESKFGPQDWAIKLTSEAGRKQLAGMLADTTVMKAIGSGAVKGGAIEGAEEIVQNPVEQLASGDNPLTKESLTETAFGGVMGAVGGGVLGGAMGPALRPRAQEVLDDTPSEDPTRDQVSGELLTTLLPEGIVLNGTKNSMANVSFPTADGQTATINIPIDEMSKLLAANKPDEIAAALEWVEQERASKIYNKTKNLPAEDYSGVTLPGTIEDKTIRGLAQGGIRSLTTDAAKAPAEQLLAEADEAIQRRRAEIYNKTRNVPAEDYSGVTVPPSRQQPSPGLGMRFSQPPVKEDVSKTPITGYEADLVKVKDTLGNEHFVQKKELAGKGKEIARYTEDGRRTVTTIPRASLVQDHTVHVDAIKNATNRQEYVTAVKGLAESLPDGTVVYDKDVPENSWTIRKKTTKAGTTVVEYEGAGSDIFSFQTRNGEEKVLGSPVLPANIGIKKPSTEPYVRLPDDPAKPDTVQYNVRGEVRTFAPAEGMSKTDIEEALAARKGPGSQVAWLQKNTTEVTNVNPVNTGQAGAGNVTPADAGNVQAAQGEPAAPGAEVPSGAVVGVDNAGADVIDVVPPAVPANGVEKSTPSASAKAPASPPQGVTSPKKVKPVPKLKGGKNDDTKQANASSAVAGDIGSNEQAGDVGSKAKLQPAVESNRWEDIYDAEPDQYMRKDILERLANNLGGNKATAQDMKTAVQKIGAEEYKDLNVLWAIAQNPATDAATKKKALQLREKRFSEDKGLTPKGTKYDGSKDGLHNYTITEGKAKGASFTVKDLSPESVQAAHDKTVKGFVRPKTAPKASVVARVAARKHEMLAPTVAEIIAEDGAKEFKRVPSVEAYTALAEARRELDPKAKIDDRLFYELASMSEKDYQEVLPLDSVESEMVASEKKTLGSDPDTLEAQAIQQGLEGKTALEATKFLVDNAPTASNRVIAEKVRNVLQRLTAQGIKFNFKIAHVGDQVPASLANARGMSSTWFNKTPMTVDVWLNGADVTGKSGMSYEVALHEFIHAATQAALHLGNRRSAAGTATAKAVADLYAVTNEIIAHFNARIEANKNDMGNLTALERAIYENRTNALANPHEILAWTLSNKEMQEYLETIKSGPETLWSKFVASIRTLLGLPVSSNTALAKVLAASETIFDAPVLELLTAAKTGVPATVAQTTAMNVEDAASKIQNEPAFKKWFAESKVVDADGKPLVVYHGTDLGNFSSFDTSQTGASWFAVDPSYASDHAMYKYRPTVDKKLITNPKVYPVYLQVNNPFDFGFRDSETTVPIKEMTERLKAGVMSSYDSGNIDKPTALKLVERLRSLDTKYTGAEKYLRAYEWVNTEPEIVGVLKESGYDGMISREGGKGAYNTYAVFSPTQIKSIFNQTWDGSNPDIAMYGSVESQMISSLNTAVKDARTTAANALASLNNPKDALHDKWLQHAPKVLAVTPLSHLAQTYGKTIHWIKDLAKHTNELEATTTRLIDDFFAIHEEAVKAAESETGIDKFNRAMLVATFNQMNPTKELSKQDWVSDKLPPGQQIVAAQKSWVDAGMQKATGMTFTQAYAEAKKEYDALGPKTQKQMVEIAKYLGKLRDMDRDASLAFIEKVSKEGSDLRKSLMEQFNNSFSRLKGMYFPLSRYGTFVLQFTGTDGRPVIEQFDSIRERKDAMLTAIANGVDEQTIVLRMQDENPAGAVAIPSELLTKLREAITTQYMTDVDKKDKEAVAAVNNQIEAALAGFNQTVLRWLPDTSALKNSMTRKSVLGANPDMLRSVNGYVQRHAGRIAWSTVGRQIEDDIAGFAGENKEMAKAGDVDLTMRGHLLNNSRMWLQAVQKERVSALTSHIGKAMTGYFMTSPSTFLVQMTQLPTLTLPHLAAKYKSYGKATSALTTAMGQAFSKKFAKEAMRGDVKVNEVYDAIHRKVSHKDRTAGKAVGTDWFSQSEKLAMVGRLTDYQKQLLALREAEARNLLDISAVHEAIDVSQGNQQGMFGKAMRLAMLPMQHGELASRKAAILASFDLASTGKKDFFEAMDETADVIDKTIYNFSKRDKGWLMQKDLMRIPFTFQTYRIKTALRLGLLFRDSLRAFKEGGMEKGLADAATKEFIGIFMTTGALAGSLGVPFAGTAMGIISLLFGSDDDEPKDMKLEYTNFLTETFGQTIGDILAYGLPTLVGTNLSRRIGMGDIYGASSQPPEQLHGAGLAAWWAGNLIGPSYSIAESWVKGYDEIMNKGNYMKGLETASPKPIKDVFKAIRTATDGVKDGAGKKLLDDSQIGPDEILMVALGFAPDEITRAQNAERSLRGISGRISTRRGRLIRQAAEGVIDGDASDALAEIREFNSKMPRFAIGGRDIKPAVRKILRGELGTTGKRERGVATQFEVPVYME